MMNQIVLTHGYMDVFLYMCRAEISVEVVDGIRVSFFNNFIALKQ